MFKAVEYVKDFLALPVIITQKNETKMQADAQRLSEMCHCIRYVNASNNKTYLYCSVNRGSQISEIRDIFARNGVRVRLHFSKYCYGNPVMRVNKHKVENNKFVNMLSVNNLYYNTSAKQR